MKLEKKFISMKHFHKRSHFIFYFIFQNRHFLGRTHCSIINVRGFSRFFPVFIFLFFYFVPTIRFQLWYLPCQFPIKNWFFPKIRNRNNIKLKVHFFCVCTRVLLAIDEERGRGTNLTFEQPISYVFIELFSYKMTYSKSVILEIAVVQGNHELNYWKYMSNTIQICQDW